MNKMFVMLAVAAILLAGCTNTAEGIGRDVEHAGQKIQKTF